MPPSRPPAHPRHAGIGLHARQRPESPDMPDGCSQHWRLDQQGKLLLALSTSARDRKPAGAAGFLVLGRARLLTGTLS
jgi:hypothetical protein